MGGCKNVPVCVFVRTRIILFMLFVSRNGSCLTHLIAFCPALSGPLIERKCFNSCQAPLILSLSTATTAAIDTAAAAAAAVVPNQIEMILLSGRKLIHTSIPGNEPMANKMKKHLLSQIK